MAATQRGYEEKEPVARDPVPKPNMLYGNRRQVMAERNLHNMLHNANQELQRMTENCHQWELAYHRAEAKYANTLRRHLNCLKEPSATSNIYQKARPVSTQTENTVALHAALAADDDDIQEDGCGIAVPLASKFEPIKPYVGSRHRVTDQVHCDTASGVRSVSPAVLTTDADKVLSGQPEPTLDRPITASDDTLSQTVECCHRTSAQSSAKNKNESSKAQAKTHFAPAPPPGISRGLFDKLAHENIRLRHVLEDVLHNRGLTIESYLVSGSVRTYLRQRRKCRSEIGPCLVGVCLVSLQHPLLSRLFCSSCNSGEVS